MSNIKFINYLSYSSSYRLFTSIGNFTLNNFTLSNSYAREDLIRLGDGTNIIENCNFIDNSGMTIYIHSANDNSLSPNVYLNNCAFTNVSVSDMNGVGTSIKINLRNSNVQINYCNFTESPAAIQTVANKLLINNSNFKNNDVNNAILYDRQKYGGAIRIYKGTVIIDSSKFENNTAIQGSSIYASVGTNPDNIINLTVINSEFETNNARDCIFYESKKGELFLENNRGTFSNSSFVDISTVSNVKSKLNLVVMENSTYDYESMIFNIIATLSDDNGNPINVSRASLYFNDELMASNLNFTKGLSNYTFKKFLNGTFLVSYTFDTNYYNFTDLDIKTAVINVSPILNKDIYVSTTGSDETGDGTEANPFKTVEKGLDIASNVLNANIYIQGGTYSFSTKKIIDTVGGTLNIIGYDGDVTIDMGSVSAFCNISERSNVSISNINFINGHYYSYNDRGIIDSNGNLTVRNCNFSNNMGYYTTVMGATLIDSCSFLNNTRYSGSGFDLYNCYCILNSTFYGSSEGSGIGSVYLRNNLNIIENSKFYNNAFITLDNARLSLIIDSCEFNNPNSNSISVKNNNNVSINNCTFSNSSQANIVLSGSNANVSVTNSKFINNTGTGTKSSIYDSNIAELYLENNTVIDNASPYVYAALTSTSSFITSPTTIVVLNNETVEVESFGAILKAKILDDNGNPIELSKLSFDFDGKTLEGNLIYDEFVAKSLGLYNGTYLVSASSNNLQNCTIKTGVLVITPLINKELYVSTTGSDETGDGTEANPYATLKKAVDEAVAYNNTIHVAEGVYAVDSALAIDTNTAIVNIVGSGANTIFDMNNVNEFITSISANSIVGLKDLTLANGYTSTVRKGGFITSSGKLTINNVNFVNSTAKQGGAIFVNGGNVTVEDSYFENTSATIGGAICGQNSYIYVLNSVFNKTTASNRAGAIQSTNYIYIKNNTFIDTSASTANNIYVSGTIEGGVVLTVMDNETWDIDSSSITFNASLTDDNGNQIYVQSTVNFYIDGVKSVSASMTGDVVTTTGTVKLNGVHVVSATLGTAEEVIVKTATINLTNPNVLHDIYISVDGNDDTGDGTIENPFASFTKALSVAETFGSTIHVMSNYTFTQQVSLSNIVDITILGETPDINFKNSTVRMFDIGENVSATFVNIKFSENDNTQQLIWVNQWGSLSLINCTYENNHNTATTTNYVHFIWHQGDSLSLINCKIINNSVQVNSQRMGVLIDAASNSSFINCTFSNNTYYNNGSAVQVTLLNLYNTQKWTGSGWSYAYTNYTASFENCIFEDNMGGFLTAGLPLTINNCSFINNDFYTLIYDGYGGGGLNFNSTITNSRFEKNNGDTLIILSSSLHERANILNNTFSSNHGENLIKLVNTGMEKIIVNVQNNTLDLGEMNYINLIPGSKVTGSTFYLVVNDNSTYDIVGSNLVLNASLADAEGHMINGATINFTLNGEYIASANLTPIAISNVKFFGDGEYIASAYTDAIYDPSELIVKTSLFNITSVLEKVIYVDIVGSDETGDGSEENPYASLSRAMEDAVALNNIIYIQAGVYDNMVLGDSFVLGDNQKVSVIGLSNEVDKVIIKNINQTFANIVLSSGKVSDDQFTLKNIDFVDSDLTSVFINAKNLNNFTLENVVLTNFTINNYLLLSEGSNLILKNCTFDNINYGNHVGFYAKDITVLDSIISNTIGSRLFYVPNGEIHVSNSVFVSNQWNTMAYGRMSLENNWWGNNTNADELRTLTGVGIANWIVAEVTANDSDIGIGDVVKFDIILKLNDGSELADILPTRIVKAIAENTVFDADEVEIADNKATISGTVNGVGDITISIDDQDFVFDVKGYNAYITVDNVAIKLGETATVTVTFTDDNGPLANKELAVKVNGEESTVTTDADGKATITLADLAKGNHIVEVNFAGDNLYDSVTGAGLVMVSDAVLTVDIPEVRYGESPTINVELKDSEGNPLSGLVTVNINGKDYNVLVKDGEGSLAVPDKFDAGEYTVSAKLIGDSITESTATFVVDKLASAMNVTVADVAYGEPFVINLDIADKTVSGLSIVTINGVDYAVEVVNGAASKAINAILPGGSYDVTAKFIGDNYDIADASTTFAVSEIVGTNVALTVKDIQYGENQTVTVTLTDANGNPISGLVKLTVGDIEQNITVDGEASVVLENLTAGNYAAIANYIGDDAYAPSNGYALFKVEKLTTYIDYQNMTTTAVDVDTDGRIGKYFYITLKDSNGKAIAGQKVQIGFNGVVYDRVTDDKGQAKLQINLKNAGTYTFAVSCLGDENYNGSFIVAKIVVNKQKGSLTVPAKSYTASAKTKTLTATFKSASGKVVKGKKISFTLNGKTYTATTDAKGVAKVNVSISKKGTYTVTAKFAGNTMYDAITKTAKLTIK